MHYKEVRFFVVVLNNGVFWSSIPYHAITGKEHWGKEITAYCTDNRTLSCFLMAQVVYASQYK